MAKSEKIDAHVLVRQAAEAWVHVTPAELAKFQGQHGLTQYALARHLRANTTSLKAWLAGERIPSLLLQARLKEALGRAPGQAPAPAERARPKALAELLAFLERTGIAQAEIARQLGVNKSTLSAWVHGTGAPSPVTQRKIRAFLRHAGREGPIAAPKERTTTARPSSRGAAEADGAAVQAKLLELLQAAIVSSGAQVQPAELPQLIRDMRAALS